MNVATRILDLLTGRDPADIVAEQFYKAMCAPPAHVQLVGRLQRASAMKRTHLLERANEATRAAALAWLAAPEATRERDRRLAWIREDAATRLPPIRHYYAGHLGDFISDLGITVDPRSVAKGKAALSPFVLWPKQRELVDWMLARWRAGEPGVVVKSRDVGASWVAMALLGSLCIFRENFAAGIASATEVKLDRSGDPDTLFYKLRQFLAHLPLEFNGGYLQDKHSAYLRINFPETGSSVAGEAGDQAGRGGRKSLYIVDEAAHFDRPKLIDASLAATTDCRIDMSSVNGVGNPFYEKAHNPDIPRFDLTWRHDPRKDEKWYTKKCAELDPVIVAQEINCDFSASVEGVLIPNAHVQAAIDLDKFLGIAPEGLHLGALDVGDTGDRNAFATRHGFQLVDVESFRSRDIYTTTQRTFALCDAHRLQEFLYDADGLGAGVRGDARVLNEKRVEGKTRALTVTEYRGSESPRHPERIVPRTNRKAKDYFANRKAQSWIHLQSLFRESYKARQGLPYDKEGIISIAGTIKELPKLIAELSQPTISETATGKMLVDKAPDGTASPNLADAVCICFSPRNVPLSWSPELLARL